MRSEIIPVTQPTGSKDGSSIEDLSVPSGALEASNNPIEQALSQRGRYDTRSPETANEYLSLLKERIEYIKPASDNGVFEKSHALVQIRLAEVQVAELWNSLKVFAHDSCIIFLTSTNERVLTRNNRQMRIKMSPNGLVGNVIVDGMPQGKVIMLKTFDGAEAKDSGLVVFLRPRPR